VNSAKERDRALAAIDALALPLEASGGPFTKVRRSDRHGFDAWLERQTGAATARFMPLFGIFLMTLVLINLPLLAARSGDHSLSRRLVAMAMGWLISSAGRTRSSLLWFR